MMIKLFGVVFIVLSCGSVGFKIAANYKKEEQYLHRFILILEYMISELNYRLTPLPQLCKQVSKLFDDPIGSIFDIISEELNSRQQSDPAMCINNVLANIKSIPPITRGQLEQFGYSVGQFDIEGQIKGLEAVQKECERNLSLHRNNRENRIRGYQTLGLCAGAALAILFV